MTVQRFKVFDTLRTLEIPYQTSRRDKPIKIPAARAHDLVAALEMDGLNVELSKTGAR